MPEFDPEDVDDHLNKHVVRGAKCALTESLETKIGSGKGSEGIFLGVAWKKAQDNVNIDQVPAGKITKVTQPDYIVIKIAERIMCIKQKQQLLKISIRNEERI